ncbi:VirK/YbjX family protein [Enterobacter sp. SA187]|uniref:VirK/YbjX family protein n=1 Tax=Enterobacter sp. SA187 TaxID=1914861 RepID=UPI0009322A15|nr:VirK/YbjX family protein [Enterobacter sp. SA187]
MTNTTLQIDAPSSPHPHLISDLIHGRLTPGPIWQKRDYRVKFLLRSLLFWPSTVKMLNSLSSRPGFDRLLSAQITLPSKSHRQYLMRGLRAGQRADAIISHYDFIDSLTSAPLAEALTAAAPVPLLEFTGKDDAPFTVYASCASKAEREGESTLWLYGADNTLLASATFSVVTEKGARALMVGGLQGPRRSVSHDVIKQSTRACYGIFPKRMLMEIFWQLAALTGITAVYGVSDKGHVFRALRYRFSKGRHFHASYDEFWASVDGTPDNAWRWKLPLQLERKSLESIASKKRAEYRRRFALMDDVQARLRALFD